MVSLNRMECVTPIIYCTYFKQLQVTSRINFYITISGILDYS